jgi:hypothetical protein
MLKKSGLFLGTILVAFLVLFASVLRAASVNYSFYPQATPGRANPSKSPQPDTAYYFVYPGNILPDSSLWYFKALRDKVWLSITVDPGKKAELALLLSDKRLMMSKTLFDRKKFELGFSTLTKGEKYMEMANEIDQTNRSHGMDTASFELRLASAALKHREVIEQQILPIAPEDAKPGIIQIVNYSKNVYISTGNNLESRGITAPANPFTSN